MTEMRPRFIQKNSEFQIEWIHSIDPGSLKTIEIEFDRQLSWEELSKVRQESAQLQNKMFKKHNILTLEQRQNLVFSKYIY